MPSNAAKTVNDVIAAANAPASVTAIKSNGDVETITGRDLVEVVLRAAGIQIGDDDTLIYPAPTSTRRRRK